MAIEAKSGVTDKSKKVSADGSYVLRTIVDSVPLASELGWKTPRITCVELWGQSSTLRCPEWGVSLVIDFILLINSYCFRGESVRWHICGRDLTFCLHTSRCR